MNPLGNMKQGILKHEGPTAMERREGGGRERTSEGQYSIKRGSRASEDSMIHRNCPNKGMCHVNGGTLDLHPPRQITSNSTINKLREDASSARMSKK
jgi:hypothetical protein